MSIKIAIGSGIVKELKGTTPEVYFCMDLRTFVRLTEIRPTIKRVIFCNVLPLDRAKGLLPCHWHWFDRYLFAEKEQMSKNYLTRAIFLSHRSSPLYLTSDVFPRTTSKSNCADTRLEARFVISREENQKSHPNFCQYFHLNTNNNAQVSTVRNQEQKSV